MTTLFRRRRGGDPGRIDQAHANRTDGCFGPRVNPNLHVQICHVIPRCLGRHSELARDLLVRRTQGHEPQHFALARSQVKQSRLSQGFANQYGSGARLDHRPADISVLIQADGSIRIWRVAT
jgi:hypothetical protein